MELDERKLTSVDQPRRSLSDSDSASNRSTNSFIYGHFNSSNLSTIISKISNNNAISISDSNSNELDELKHRMNLMEQSIKSMNTLLQSTVQTTNKLLTTSKSFRSTSAGSSVSNFVDALTAKTITMDAKTVETCSIIAFFFIGIIIGSSLLDRLWLLGGIVTAWWASGVVQKSSRGGRMVRKVGVQLARLVMDIQEKYNQFVIFYRTGKLAYHSSKVWDEYDRQFMITKRVEEWKKMAMMRAVSSLNQTIDKASLLEKWEDIWKVMSNVPQNAQQINKKYHVISSVKEMVDKTWEVSLSSVQKIFHDEEERRGQATWSWNISPVLYSPFPSSTTSRRSSTPNLITKMQRSITNAIDVIFDLDTSSSSSSSFSWPTTTPSKSTSSWWPWTANPTSKASNSLKKGKARYQSALRSSKGSKAMMEKVVAFLFLYLIFELLRIVVRLTLRALIL